GILRVKNIEVGRTVVGIDYDLHAVADVVDQLVPGAVMVRIRIGRGLSKSIDNPEETPIITNYYIRIVVINQERGDAIDDVADIAVNQDSALGGHIVRER